MKKSNSPTLSGENLFTPKSKYLKNHLLYTVIAITLLSIPTFNFAQAPNLGTAANFVLFTSSGAVTNTGTTRLTGNVGSNSGSSTGFGNVNGNMLNNNGATATAAADLLTAYNQLNTTTATMFPAPLLGNGDTLNAGVYSIGAPSTLNNTLNLNANGNPNAVFIFKIQGAFSTGAAAKVKLLNGAQACNVFWKVEGLISLATNTAMAGTLIANNSAITMSTGVNLDGRALSTAGAISMNALTAKIPAGCGKALLTGPAAPTMATTSCYAIFSGNGSVTNTGISKVTGDIGTNVGLTTGYNALDVQGKIHPIPDGNTAAAAADLSNVYSYLNTLPVDIELLYPAQFGNNLTLTPHTYLLNSATAFTDTLILDAETNADAVFVIKINGALSTSTYATVILKNGAKASNIFWKVEGAVDINNYSKIKGTIVCNNGAFSLSTGADLEGRALTTNGALNTNAIKAVISSPCNTFPVTWLYFRGQASGSTVNLVWGTTNEVNNKAYIVERSTDGKNFEAIATIAAKAKAGSDAAYTYTDISPLSSKTFYRIKQVDLDARYTYSDVITVETIIKTKNSFTVSPNPVQSVVRLQVESIEKQLAQISITDLSGKIIYSKKVNVEKGNQSLMLNDLRLDNGVYLTTITFNQSKVTARLMKL